MNISRRSILLFSIALLFCVANMAVGLISPDFYERVMAGELGVVENVQVLFLAIALLVNIRMISLVQFKDYPTRMKAWLWVTALGIFYVLGEEISWGQHYFGWDAFGWFMHTNDQLETNLHNTSSWFDQKPRLILITGILIGGLIMPLMEKYRGKTLTKLPVWFKPTMSDVPLALLVVLAQMPKQINKLGIPGVEFQIAHLRFSEMQEVVIYMYFVAYLMSLWKHHIKKA
jgi:multisubunit Na+/H+ antiporter MnhG subunit